MISQIGDGLTRVALLLFVYDLTGSALKMTVIGVLQTIPPLPFGPFADVYLDRLPKRGTLIVIDLARVGLLVLIPMLYAMGSLSLRSLYVMVVVISCFSMAYGPGSNRMPKKSASGVLALFRGSTYRRSTRRLFARYGLAGRAF